MADSKSPQPDAVPTPRVTTAIEAAALAIVDKDLDGDEGVLPYAYPDSLGFLTIGRGILIDKRKAVSFSRRDRLHQPQPARHAARRHRQ